VKAVCSFALSFALLSPTYGQSSPQAAKEDQSKTAPQEPVTTLKQPLAFGLEDGTPVRMRITRNLSSADATTGDRVDFEVLDDVKMKDVILIPRGSIALGTVTQAQPKRRMARGGKLDVNIDDVKLSDGERAPLRAVKEMKGGGHTGAMTGAMIGTAIVFFPAAPLFLFMHGKDITIPKGTEITAYVNGDISLDPKRFTVQNAAPQENTGAAGTAQTDALVPMSASNGDTTHSAVEIKSTPDGAEITVDDKFMGTTPSTLRLTTGDHKIKLQKTGFKTWEKTLSVGDGGTPTLNVTLEAQ
jgi:hypothetical protein